MKGFQINDTANDMHGIAIINTNSQSFGWVTMKDDVMHGPIIFHGLMPVNPVRCTLLKLTKYF